MKKTGRKMLSALLAAVFCAVLAACGENAAQSEPQIGKTQQMPPAHECAPEERMELPVMLRAPQRTGALMTLLSGGVLGGAFTAVSSCSTRDLYTDGALRVQVSAVSETGQQDAAFALWKLGSDASEYMQSVSFLCDGTVREYTFSPLEKDAEYRIVFSCADSRSRMSGTFAVEGVTAEAQQQQEEPTPLVQ